MTTPAQPTAKRARAARATPHTLRLMGQSRAALFFQDAHCVYVKNDGKRLTSKVLPFDQATQALTQRVSDSGWLAPQLRRYGTSETAEWAVQFSPPQRYAVTLPHRLEGEEDELKIELMLPAFVFAGHGTTYHLWAVPGQEFDPEAVIHHAPLPNVYSGGRICWGGNTAPEVTDHSLDRAWSLFLRSPYSDNETRGKSRKHPEHVCQALFAFSKRRGQRRPYPVSDLVPYKMTVEEAVAYVATGQFVPTP